MITLEVGNSESSIVNLDMEHFKKLRKELSYCPDAKASYFSGGFNRPIPLIDKRGVFPTGLIHRVKGFLSKSNLQYIVNDKRRLPKAQGDVFKMSLGYKPYPEQNDAAASCRRFKRGILVAPTGVGKSAMITLAINELQVPTLIVVPSLELKRQLSQTLSDAFGSASVGRNKLIYVENIDGLESKTPTTKYDCLIIDEFHHSGAKTYRKLNKKQWKDIYYRFGFTATPFRSQDNEQILLESVLSEVIYQVSYQTAVEKAYIVPMEAYYYELPRAQVKGRTWTEVYAELIVNNTFRNEFIAKLLVSLAGANISALCLVKEIKHGNILSELSDSRFANGENEETKNLIDAFNKAKIPVLVGTNGVLGEGVDTKPAEFVIIAGLGKSKNAFHQQIGRGFRRYLGKETCKVILFLDPSHKFTKDHFKAQCKYLREDFGVIPAKLQL